MSSRVEMLSNAYQRIANIVTTVKGSSGGSSKFDNVYGKLNYGTMGEMGEAVADPFKNVFGPAIKGAVGAAKIINKLRGGSSGGLGGLGEGISPESAPGGSSVFFKGDEQDQGPNQQLVAIDHKLGTLVKLTASSEKDLDQIIELTYDSKKDAYVNSLGLPKKPGESGSLIGGLLGSISSLFSGGGILSSLGKVGGGLLSTVATGGAAAAGGGLLSKIGSSGIGKLAGGIGKRIPLIGGLLSGGMELASGGDLTDAIGSGAGAGIGGAIGATLGSVVPGLGTAIGGVAGSMAGEWLGKQASGLFKMVFGESGGSSLTPSEIGKNLGMDEQEAANRNMSDVIKDGIIAAFDAYKAKGGLGDLFGIADLKESQAGNIGTGISAPEYRATASNTVKTSVASAPSSTGLGSLSAQYESNGNSSTIGYDAGGGTSYGKYQISSQNMPLFMEYAKRNNPEIYAKLSAGGTQYNTGGKGGAMPDAWRSVANDPNSGKALADLEHQFIKKTHYDEAYDKLDPKMQELVKNDPALQQVLWSRAVQTGATGASTDFNNVYSGMKDNYDRKGFISQVYDKSANRFSESKLGSGVYSSVQNRLKNTEKSQALAYADANAPGTAIASNGNPGAETEGMGAPGILRSGTEPFVANGANMSGVDSGFMQRFTAAAQEYYAATGNPVKVTSGFRSFEDQERLKKQKPNLAATPGKSMHEYGYALDIDSGTANQMAAMGLFDKYGIIRPVGNEPWHIEPSGLDRAAVASNGSRAAQNVANASSIAPISSAPTVASAISPSISNTSTLSAPDPMTGMSKAPISPASQSVRMAEGEVAQADAKSQANMVNTITNSNKQLASNIQSASSSNVNVINSGGKSGQSNDIPDTIESMGILLTNTSCGLS